MTIDHDAISRAQAAIENGLIEALQSQAQADMDGTTVIVSRQACDEAAEFLPALYYEVKRLRADLRHVIDERDATFALMLARAEKAEAERVAEWNRRREAEASRDLEKAVCATIKAERDALRAALKSIADNTCCDGCREAALVARQALKGQTND